MNLQRLLAVDSSSDEDEDEFIQLVASVLLTRRVHRFWIADYLKRRDDLGEFNLFYELNDEQFKNYFRLNRNQFFELKNLIEIDVSGKNSNFRKCIPTDMKIAVCLRYLASGNSFTSLGYSYRLGDRTVARIVETVCEAIWRRLKDIVLPKPTTERWLSVASSFKERWNFDNCVGAIDGKHVVIKAPSNSGSAYFNYKKTFSVVLLAVSDANGQFLMIDTGSMGRFSDGGILRASAFGQHLRNQTLGLPDDAPLVENGPPAPFVFVGDEAFPLQRHLMRPFPRAQLDNEKRIFNYRLCRARRTVENLFGTWSATWRVFRKPLECKVDIVISVINAAVVLHNFIRQGLTIDISEEESERDPNPQQLLPLARIGSHATREAHEVREVFVQHFNNAGSVPWQNNIIGPVARNNTT